MLPILTLSVADQSRQHHFVKCLWKLEFRSKWLGRLAALSSMEFAVDSDKNVCRVHIKAASFNLLSQISHMVVPFHIYIFF